MESGGSPPLPLHAVLLSRVTESAAVFRVGGWEGSGQALFVCSVCACVYVYVVLE
jgi:hypothetical protein